MLFLIYLTSQKFLQQIILLGAVSFMLYQMVAEEMETGARSRILLEGLV